MDKTHNSILLSTTIILTLILSSFTLLISEGLIQDNTSEFSEIEAEDPDPSYFPELKDHYFDRNQKQPNDDLSMGNIGFDDNESPGIPFWKIEPQLLYSLKFSDSFEVKITSLDMHPVYELLEIGTSQSISGERKNPNRMQTSVLTVPNFMIPRIASLSSVISIQTLRLPKPPEFPETGDPADPGEYEPSMWNAVKYHAADSAWDLGFDGTGVNVAVLDTGVDFGHPDLNGTQARVENPSSPYFGWPIAFDSRSVNSYLNSDGQGFTGPGGEDNWFSDTSSTDSDSNGNGTLDGLGMNVTGIVSQSGVYHHGRHPDTRLRNIYGEYVRILVVDENVPGVYDTVYVNLDNDNNFTDEKPARRGDETSTHDLGADGIPDRSGGMIYFIADGVNPVPYSDIIASENGQTLPIPVNGSLVAFMINDITEAGGNHGTLCASAVAGQGVIASGRVTGTAPNAKIIAVGNIYQGGNDLDEYYFAVEGYDGIPGTGDEAQIVSCSFGDSDVINLGWDFTSRFVDNITTYYAPNVTFSVASGNGGYGYGTVVSPGSSMGAVTVGAALNARNTEVVCWSNRGPNAVGQLDPDVVSVGVGAFGDQPLNQKNNGNSAYQSWSGTSLATPVTAGILALIYDAYSQANGEFPSSKLSREIIMSTADNLNYDPLVQGAGFSNATRAVMVANNTKGMLLSPTFWTAGDYRGSEHEGFAKIMHPGDSDSITVSVTNKDQNGTLDVNITDHILTQSNVHRAAFNSNKSELDGSNNRPDFFITLHDSINNISHIPDDTALLKVSGFMPYDQFDKDMNYNQENRFTLTIYDWRDTNANGSYWNDTNSDGVAQVGEMEWSELTSIVSSGIVATTQEARMHDPLTRITDGLVVGVFHLPAGGAVQFTDIYIQAQTYKRTDWDWLDTNPSSLSIGTDSTSTFSATLTVPPQTPIGLYEGMIVLNEPENESTFPVIVNVAGNSEKFNFGGNTLSTDLYANDQVLGGFRWGWRYEGGDWRFYFTDIPDSFDVKPGTKLIADVKWDNYPTDIDVFLLGGVDDDFSDENPDRYGPYTLDIKGRSANQYIWAGKFRFNTTTGTTQEIIAADLSPGLNEIILHNVLFSGQWFSENTTGEMGTVNVTPHPWDLGFIDSVDDLSATQMFTLLSSFNITNLTGRAYGVYPPMDYPNELVYQNDPSDETTSNWSKELNVAGAQYIRVNTSSEIAMDIDLYLLKDDGDGIPEWGPEEVASSTSPDDEEEIKYDLPADGRYWVFVHGWNVPANPSPFDCYIEVVYGNDINVTNLSAGPIMKNEPTYFNASVVLPPQGGEYRGVIKVQLGGLYETIEIPFLAELESDKPIISDLWPPNGTMINLTQPPISARYHDLGSGINSSRVYILIDGVNQTQNATITDSSISIIPSVPLAPGNHTVFLTVSDNFENTQNVTWTFTIDLVNPILTADAGIDKNSIEDELVSFSANLTTGENPLDNFTWDFGDGNFGYGPNPTHDYPNEGTYIVILTVTDIANNTDSDSLNVYVTNMQPVADAGSDQSGLEGDTFLFNANASSDTPSDIPKLIYYWNFEDGTVLTGISVDFVFTDNGNYTVTLIVEDDNGLTDSDTVFINISNVAPIADIGGPYSGLEGSSIAFSAQALDPGSDTLTFEWDLDDNGLYNDATGTNPQWIWYDEGNYQIRLKVTDDDGEYSFDSIWVTVDNVAPVADCGGPYQGIEGTQITLSGSASDPGMDTLTYSWDLDNDGNYNDGTGFDPNWVWDDNGIYTIGLMVSDGDGGFGFDTTTVTIENAPPSVDIGGSFSGFEGIEISFTSDVFDLGVSDTIMYLWDFGDGHTSSLEDPTHIYSDNGEYPVTLTVTDSDGGVSSATATCSVANLDPQIDDVDPEYIVKEDELFRLQIIAFDVPADTITYSDDSAMFDIDSITGEIEFTPLNSHVGGHEITVTAKDEDGGEAEITFTIVVSNENDAPILSEIGPQIAYEDQEFVLIVEAMDPDSGDNIMFSDDTDLFDIDPGEGLIYFRPTNNEVGVWTVTISVSDRSGATDSESVMFTIVNINDAPVLEGIPVQYTKVGEPFTFTVSASDDDDPTLTYSDDSELFVIDPVSGTIAFTPKRGDEGLHVIQIAVTDQSGASDTKTLTLDIEGLPEPGEGLPWYLLVLLIIIIVALILLFLFLKRKKEDEKNKMAQEDIDSQEVEDEIDSNEELDENIDEGPFDKGETEIGGIEDHKLNDDEATGSSLKEGEEELGPSEFEDHGLLPQDDK